MNARARAATTTISPTLPPPSPFTHPPRQYSTRECMTTSTWADKVGDALSRGGDRSGCDIRAVIVLNLLRAVLFTLPLTPAGCVVHRSRNLTWLQIKPSTGYSQPPTYPLQFRSSRRTMIAGLSRNIETTLLIWWKFFAMSVNPFMTDALRLWYYTWHNLLLGIFALSSDNFNSFNFNSFPE